MCIGPHFIWGSKHEPHRLTADERPLQLRSAGPPGSQVSSPRARACPADVPTVSPATPLFACSTLISPRTSQEQNELCSNLVEITSTCVSNFTTSTNPWSRAFATSAKRPSSSGRAELAPCVAALALRRAAASISCECKQLREQSAQPQLLPAFFEAPCVHNRSLLILRIHFELHSTRGLLK